MDDDKRLLNRTRRFLHICGFKYKALPVLCPRSLITGQGTIKEVPNHMWQ